ncbi:hypothetical protein OH491_05145 [Termitidicoccus mucosus]
MNTQNKTNPAQSAPNPARASASDDAFFQNPVDPKAEARAMAAEAIAHVLLWISEGIHGGVRTAQRYMQLARATQTCRQDAGANGPISIGKPECP